MMSVHAPQTTALTNGKLTKGLPFTKYLEIEAEHASGLKHMLVSPLHYRHARDGTVNADKAALRMGRAVHTSILEPDRFALEYAVYTESKSKGEGSRKAWDAFKAANANRTILDEAEYTKALAIRNAVRRNPIAADLLAKGDSEVTATWTHRSTGLPCKARYDWLGPRGIVDVKTTRQIDPQAFSRDVARLAYNVQFGIYAEGHREITGHAVPFWAIVVESSAPFDSVVYSVPASLTDSGWRVAWGLLDRVAECRRDDRWPGVAGDAALELTLPEWANGSTKTQGLELELEGGELVSF